MRIAQASRVALLLSVVATGACSETGGSPGPGASPGGGGGAAASGPQGARSGAGVAKAAEGGLGGAGGSGAAAGRSGAPGGDGALGGAGVTAGRSAGGGRGGAGTGGGRGGRGAAGDQSGGAGAAGDAGDASTESSYDAAVLADAPVAFWAMSGTSSELDLTGHGHDGSYRGGAPARASLPNGDAAADFDGVSQYLTVPSSTAFSIPTTGHLTWEAWIRPDVLEFPHATNGYVDWIGKCEEYSPTCEWEGRLYSLTNSENRCNRLSAYAFNPDANLGSGAFWQETDCGVSIVAGSFYHVVGEYRTDTQPPACSDAANYPGAIDIWVNAIEWNQSTHGETGCMSQYQVVPEANGSALNVGTMARDAWFAGAVGKVAIYDHLLSDAAIRRHYETMTGEAPAGSCGSTCSL